MTKTMSEEGEMPAWGCNFPTPYSRASLGISQKRMRCPLGVVTSLNVSKEVSHLPMRCATRYLQISLARLKPPPQSSRDDILPGGEIAAIKQGERVSCDTGFLQ